ncbi:MAG: aldo/keto reductase [Acholeplasmataceae bacterium]|nr:aldo/keto reductase [Acholeplasmataceae bacterium]
MKMISFYNGYQIPQLGLGTFLMSPEQAEATVIEAIKVGYRHFDTAQMYQNEVAIGNELKKSGLKREEYYLTTKLGNHHSVEVTKKKIEQSLKDLKTNYVDLFLIHWPNHDLEINLRTWRVIEEYYKKGVFKAIGVSNFTRYQMDNLLEKAVIKPMANQIETHPALSQVPTKKYLDEREIRLISYAPLMRGHFNESPYFEVLAEIANNHKATIAQIAIAWGLNREIIMIPKTVTKSRLIENFAARKIVLTANEMEQIFALNRGRRYYTDPANTIHGDLLE